jgi:DNA-binding XRE family transcriptional regulator
MENKMNTKYFQTIINFENDKVKPKLKLRYKSSVINITNNWEFIKIKLNSVIYWNNLIIVKVVNSNLDIFLDEIKTEANIKIYTINYDKFFNEKNPIMDWIIYNNSSLEDTIFIFEGKNWENIKKSFKISGTWVHGGNIKSRHMLSSCQSTLTRFLNILNI